MPRPTDSAPCGSKSTSSTRRPYSASAAPRLIVDVVLPTPPFWLHSATMRAGPCPCTGGGSGAGFVPRGRPDEPAPDARSLTAGGSVVDCSVVDGSTPDES